MDESINELIAIGASVGAHCQPCLAHHLEKARELNVSEEDIQNAIEIGFMVEKGALSAMRKFTDKIIKQSQNNNEPCCPPGSNSKCCG